MIRIQPVGSCSQISLLYVLSLRQSVRPVVCRLQSLVDWLFCQPLSTANYFRLLASCRPVSFSTTVRVDQFPRTHKSLAGFIYNNFVYNIIKTNHKKKTSTTFCGYSSMYQSLLFFCKWAVYYNNIPDVLKRKPKTKEEAPHIADSNTFPQREKITFFLWRRNCCSFCFFMYWPTLISKIMWIKYLDKLSCTISCSISITLSNWKFIHKFKTILIGENYTLFLAHYSPQEKLFRNYKVHTEKQRH